MATRDEKRHEALREARMRRSVYRARVAEGSMSLAEAERRIAIMEEIAEDYREPGLFDER